MFRLRLRLKMRFIAMSMVSGSGILVKKGYLYHRKREIFWKDLHS